MNNSTRVELVGVDVGGTVEVAVRVGVAVEPVGVAVRVGAMVGVAVAVTVGPGTWLLNSAASIYTVAVPGHVPASYILTANSK